MARKKLSFVGQCQNFGADIFNQSLCIASGKVGAANRPIENGIANKSTAILWTIEHDTAGRVPGNLYHIKLILSHRHYIAFMKMIVNFDTSAVEFAVDNILACLLLEGSTKEGIGRRCGNLHAIAVADVVVAKTMVEMKVCIDYLSDFEFVLFNISVEEFSFGRVEHTRVDYDSLKRIAVIGDKRAFSEKIEGELSNL